MNTLRAGALRDRVTIQRPTGAEDSWGMPEPQGWVDLAKVWADVRFQSGSESIRAGADVSIVRASVRIRWRTDIDASMRVLFGAQVLDIEAVLPDRGRVHVDLVCKLPPVTDAPPPDPVGGGWG